MMTFSYRLRGRIEMYPKQTSANLSEEIVEVLFSEGAFEDKPVTEQQLADRFQVSRTPIREALKELEGFDIIARKQKKGIHLKKPSIELLVAVYDVRSALEGFAGRLATQKVTDEDLRELETLARQFTEGREEGHHEKCEAANIAFHNKIIELSGNPLLIQIMKSFSIIRQAFKLAYSIQPERKGVTTPYPHEEIVEKMKAGDTEGCEKLLRAHIQRAKKGLIEQLLGFKLDCFSEM